VGVLTSKGVDWLEERSGAGRALVLVPSEHVLVLAADLPLPSRRRRAAAAPFAVEGRLAEPLSNLHIALGPEIAPRRHLVAIVRRAVFDGWSGSLAAAGASDAAIAPDYVALPYPEAGAWAAWIENDRAVVRTAEDTGFAIGAGALAAAWRSGGRPRLVVYAGAPPTEIPFERGECDPLATAAAAHGFDLGGADVQAETSSVRAGLRALAAMLVIGVVGHLGLAAVETAALNAQASARRAEAAALLEDIAPGASTTTSDDIVATLAAYAPRSAQRGTDAAFLMLLSRASAALSPFSSGLAVRGLSFDGDAGALSIALEAPDLAALQEIEEAFAAAGLATETGAATMARGAAEARFTVRDGVPRAARGAAS
jgi:general secretion pathway protein L